MPIDPHACNGPCNTAARKAWETYDQALAIHDHEMQLHTDAYHRHLDQLAAWHPPLVHPVEPRRPEPPQPPAVRVVAGFPWCSRCARLLRHALAELDDTAALLAAGVDGHRGAAMSGPNGIRPLAHTAIVDELDELYGFLVSVEDQWREARGYPERPRRARGAHARAVSVGWLLGQLDDLLLDPWSVEVGLEVLRWHRRLLRLSKSDPASRRSPIACPRCGERQVSRGDDYYECGSCGRLLNQREHDDEYARQADEHEQQEAHA